MPSVTPDLVPPTTPPYPSFPLARSAKPLTLYPGTPGEVRVHWRLHADEVAGHGARFPRADGAMQAVVRLGHARTEGGSEPIREQRLRLSGLSGSGELTFRIGDDFALLEAELGLMNPEGGWLLLARSNRLQPAPGLGLESLRRPPAGTQWDSDAEAADSGAVPADQAGARSEATTDTEHPGSTGVSVTSQIPVLTYADAGTRVAGVVIEAELRLHGWSAPNTLIDLFGHRYRVGPGGRFQLSLKVDDPELIRRALERHPPPDPGDPR